MKLPSKKVIASAAAFVVTLNMNGCGVYGPAPYEDSDTFTAEANMNADVYGPAPIPVETAETAETSETVETAEFFPSDNYVATVYGPPEYSE